MSRIFFAALFLLSAAAKAQPGFRLAQRTAQKQVDVFYNKQLLTSYCFYDSVRKPVLFPVNTVDGIAVTRGYPIAPRPGERTDHPHHVGIWLNYESVNGLDFWNNSTAVAPEKRNLYGTIRHQKIVRSSARGNAATLVTAAVWVRPDNKVLLNEQTTFQFSVQGTGFIIDWITTLTANDTAVVFKDAKDGMVAIRVARELELPSKEASSYVDDKGNVTTVPQMSAEGITGNYIGSTGLQGDSVWSSKGPWVMLTGRKQGKPITIGLIDHPSNVGYPTYWHARGYGLFAANPLGRKIFSKGAAELNFTLQPKQSVVFKYRFVIQSGTLLTASDMERLANDFSKK